MPAPQSVTDPTSIDNVGFLALLIGLASYIGAARFFLIQNRKQQPADDRSYLKDHLFSGYMVLMVIADAALICAALRELYLPLHTRSLQPDDIQPWRLLCVAGVALSIAHLLAWIYTMSQIMKIRGCTTINFLLTTFAIIVIGAFAWTSITSVTGPAAG